MNSCHPCEKNRSVEINRKGNHNTESMLSFILFWWKEQVGRLYVKVIHAFDVNIFSGSALVIVNLHSLSV